LGEPSLIARIAHDQAIEAGQLDVEADDLWQQRLVDER